MAVTHTTVGFKGTVGQSEEAQRMARLGPRGTVAGPADWVVTATSGDRAVSIAAGSGQSCGVLDRTTASDILALEANGNSSTGTRYDLVVARFRWTDPVTPVAFAYITGAPGAGVPTIGNLVRTPGTQYDMPLAVVRVAGGQGTLTANDIFDVRMWGGVSGPLMTNAKSFINVLDVPPGDLLRLPPTSSLPARILTFDDNVWRLVAPAALPAVVGAWNEPPGDFGFSDSRWEITRLTLPDPGVAYRVQARARGELGAAATSGTRVDMELWLHFPNGTWQLLDTDQGREPALPGKPDDVTFQQITTGLANTVITGSCDVVIRAFRVYGLAAGRITGPYKHFTATQWAV